MRTDKIKVYELMNRIKERYEKVINDITNEKMTKKCIFIANVLYVQ